MVEKMLVIPGLYIINKFAYIMNNNINMADDRIKWFFTQRSYFQQFESYNNNSIIFNK